MGRSVLYFDTYSVIYIENVDEAPKVHTGDYLGDLRYELEEFGSGSFIEGVLSVLPKKLCIYGLLRGYRETYI